MTGIANLHVARAPLQPGEHFAARPRPLLVPDEASVGHAVQLPWSAKRPLLISGRAARGGSSERIALLDALGAPCLDTGESKGLVPESHPSVVAAMRAAVMGEADLVVAIGRRLDFQLGCGSPAVFGASAFGFNAMEDRHRRPPSRAPAGRGRQQRPADRGARPVDHQPPGDWPGPDLQPPAAWDVAEQRWRARPARLRRARPGHPGAALPLPIGRNALIAWLFPAPAGRASGQDPTSTTAMTAHTALNLLPYGGTSPELTGPPRHAAAGHALVGRITLGRDAWLGAGVVIRADGHYVRGGDDLHMGRGSTVHIAHDVYPALIGDHVTVGANAVVHACTVHDDCVIEEDCVILDGAAVEAGSVIEAGAVVFARSQLPGGWLYAGRPAKPVRELQPGELADWRAMLRARNEAAADDWDGSDVTAVLAPSAFIGNTALLRGRIRAAERSSIWYGCRLDAAEGEIVIGARSNVQDNSVLAPRRGAIRIGVDTTVGHNVALAECTIGDRCLIGIGSRVAPGTIVEDDVFLAAGATTAPGQVLASGFLWGGQPARELTVLDKRKKALVLETIITYCDYADELKLAQANAAAARAA